MQIRDLYLRSVILSEVEGPALVPGSCVQLKL
jgi:hypothetical protein